MEDAEIIQLYLKRDEQAIEQTDNKYGQRLWNMAQRIVGDEADSDECVNDTYLKVWNNIPPHEPYQYFFAFLAKIMRNTAINRYNEKGRDKRRAHVIELTQELEGCLPAAHSVEDVVEMKEIIRIINDYLRKKPKEKRIIFVQRYYFCDSTKAISERFGYSEGKVKNILYRMRNELRDVLQKEGVHG